MAMTGVSGRPVVVPTSAPGGQAKLYDSSKPTKKTADGSASEKTGPIRISPAAWEGDPLAAWKGPVNGKERPPHTLSNPARLDGLAIFRGADPNGSFVKDSADVPHTDLLYTEGNYWTDGKGGAVKGADLLPIKNATGGGVLFAGSMTPGYEQPGAALTAVKNGEDGKYVPTPAHGWLEDVGLSKYSQPQVWVSVKDVDPGSVEGWHQSDARPGDDPNNEDHGTPAFAYGITVRDNGPGKDPDFSLSSSEGYDPKLTKEPGYGMMVVATTPDGKTHVVAAVSIQNVEGNTADGVGYFDPDFGAGGEVNKQGGVTVGGSLAADVTTPDGVTHKGVTYELVLAPSEFVDDFIDKQEAENPGHVVRAEHVSVPGV